MAEIECWSWTLVMCHLRVHAWLLPCEDLPSESEHPVVEILMILIVATVEARGQLVGDGLQLVVCLTHKQNKSEKDNFEIMKNPNQYVA
jgi:hypothetical protein